MSYKSDIVVLSGMIGSISFLNWIKIKWRIREKSHIQFLLYLLGLDSGDRKALDAKFKPTDAPPCQFDKEDLRFVLKGKAYFQTFSSLRINESLIYWNWFEASWLETNKHFFKGPHFAPMEILNCLAQERGYKVEYNPQQHTIPLKQGATDDK